jgi:hypothetical protein
MQYFINTAFLPWGGEIIKSGKECKILPGGKPPVKAALVIDNKAD